MTILDCCISLKRIKKFGCVGSCGYAPASVKYLKVFSDQKKFGCDGSCGYAPASVKYLVSTRLDRSITGSEM